MTEPAELQIIRSAVTARDQAAVRLARAVRASEDADLTLGAAMLVAYNAGVGNASDYARLAGFTGRSARQKAWDLMRQAAEAEGVSINRRRQLPGEGWGG